MIYLDHNATTPLCPAAREAMEPFLERHYGNPSSIHSAGRETRAAIDEARDRLARLLGAKPHELVFTGTGTESNNLAVLGLARQNAERGRHLITSGMEHHAVLNVFEHLQRREAFDVTFLDGDRTGRIDPSELERALRTDTTLVSIMAANNETGVLQPLSEISKICRARRVLLHSDMVQSFGKIGLEHEKEAVLPSEVEGSRGANLKLTQRDPSTPLRSARDDGLSLVDAASFAAHKFYGPKGAGLLYLRAGVSLAPTQFGGTHENQRRPGTENVPAIVGMAAAAEWILRDQSAEQLRQAALRDRLWAQIATAVPTAIRNGDPARSLANTLNVSFPGHESETILMALDLEGVCASSGSACMVGSVVASHVLLAMGLPMESANSAIRFSLGHQTTTAEIDAAGSIIRDIFHRFRSNELRASDLTAASRRSEHAII